MCSQLSIYDQHMAALPPSMVKVARDAPAPSSMVKVARPPCGLVSEPRTKEQIEKKKDPASFLLTLSTWRRCNLTVKTQVFLKILTSSLLSFLLVILAHEAFKNYQKLVSKTSQNHPKTLFDISCVLETLP